MAEPLNADIRQDSVAPGVGEMVELFQVDLTRYGAGTFYFTTGTVDGANPSFGGQEYVALPCEAEGFEWNPTGAPPRPKLRFANVTRAFNGLLQANNDLVGGRVTRIRTLKKYLDGQASENPDAHWPLEIYRIERKSNHNRIFIEWDLAAPIDVEGAKIPGRRILRDYCSHTYRVYDADAETFNHSEVSCPYRNDRYVSIDNQITTNPAEDRCAKTLKACRLRFGEFAVLPFAGFPGVARRIL